MNLACVKPGGGFLSSGLKDYAGDFRPEQVFLPGELGIALTDVTQHGSVIGRPLCIPEMKTRWTLVASLDIAKVVVV